MTTEPVPQLGHDDVKEMSPAEIHKARRQGMTRDLERGIDHGRTGAWDAQKPSQLSRNDLAAMSAAQIVEARKQGRLKNLLGLDS